LEDGIAEVAEGSDIAKRVLDSATRSDEGVLAELGAIDGVTCVAVVKEVRTPVN
jgi:hypothetical protein